MHIISELTVVYSFALLPPIIAEEVIFSVVSLYVCVSPSEFAGHRSKANGINIKNVIIPISSLVSEKVGQGKGERGQEQGHEGQGRRLMPQGQK